jgi:hypothetical protein
MVMFRFSFRSSESLTTVPIQIARTLPFRFGPHKAGAMRIEACSLMIDLKLCEIVKRRVLYAFAFASAR